MIQVLPFCLLKKMCSDSSNSRTNETSNGRKAKAWGLVFQILLVVTEPYLSLQICRPRPCPPPLVSSQSGVYTSPPINFLPQQPPVTYGPLPPASSSKEVYYLPKFNERCAQQKLDVAYQAENQGSPHAPKWVIKCMGEPHDCFSFTLISYLIFSLISLQ